MKPAFSGLSDFKINFRMHQNKTVLIIPLKTGETNQEPIILPVKNQKISLKFLFPFHFQLFSALFLPNVVQATPCVPRATRLKPIVEPTILCVPEIGSFKNVATNNQRALLANADTKPNINSVSEFVYKSTSKMPLRIVSETL